MGLESTSRSTVTSMREVGGGGLYLRPRCAESCAERPIPVTATRATATVRVRKERLDSMPVLYPLTCAWSERWVVVGSGSGGGSGGKILIQKCLRASQNGRVLRVGHGNGRTSLGKSASR